MSGTEPPDTPVAAGRGGHRLGSVVQAINNRSIVLAALTAGLLLLSLLAADLLRARYHALEGAHRATVTAASVMAEHLNLAVAGVDNLLINIRHDLSAGMAADQVLRAAAKSHPYLRAVHVVDATGQVTASTEAEAVGMRVGDRDYFQAHLGAAGATDRLRFGTPIIGRDTGHAILPVSRRLETAQGRFAGLVFGALDRDYLAVFLATQALGLSGSVGLHSASGGLLAGQAAPVEEDGRAEAIIATHDVGDLPLIVRVTVSRQVALAEWSNRAKVYGLFAIGLVLLLGAMAALLALYTRRAREALDAAMARAVAERANRHKSDFLSRMSHELRTPVAAMDVIAADLEGSPLNEDQRSQVATLRASAGYLLSMVGSVLDLARVEAGRLDLLDLDFTPARMLEQVERLMMPSAAAKGLRLEVTHHALPTRMEGDAVRVQQVLLNLIGNAIKYTQTGHVAVTARVDRSDPGTAESGDGELGCRLVFTVSDTGPGLPAALRDGVFERFAGAGPARPDSSGLGLVVARQLCDAMGGSLEVAETSTRGTTFRFAVPVRLRPDRRTVPRVDAADPVPPPPRPPAVRPRGAAPAGRPAAGDATLSLLLAEDDPAQSKVFRATLGAWGHAVEVCGAGDIALEAARRGAHDALIVDVHLPGLDGLEVVRRLRAEGRSVPIIGLTAALFSEDHERFRSAGFDHLLIKPVHWDDLRALLCAVPAPVTSSSASAPGSADGPLQ